MATSYRYIDTNPQMIFTDDRLDAIRLIKTGSWSCSLCPQMFGLETGVYGLLMAEKKGEMPKEDAEKFLSEVEESGKRAFSNDPFSLDNISDKLAGIPLPNQI